MVRVVVVFAASKTGHQSAQEAPWPEKEPRTPRVIFATGEGTGCRAKRQCAAYHHLWESSQTGRFRVALTLGGPIRGPSPGPRPGPLNLQKLWL